MARDLRPHLLDGTERMSREHPEFMDMAREVLTHWESGKTTLLPVVAQGLLDAYTLGLAKTPIARKRFEEEEEEEVEEAQPPPRVRRTRAVAEPPVPAARMRRTRPA